MNILIIRNDKLGDFMLAYPALALVKQSMPGAKVSVLVPEYTREMAEACPDIDNIIIDPGSSANFSQQLNLLKEIRRHHFDAAITLFSTSRVGWLLLLAGIPFRLAPATKIAQVFYNQRLTQRRSRSLKPEFEYNCDLVRHFLSLNNIAVNDTKRTPYLHFDKKEVAELASQFREKFQLLAEHKLVFIHPGSGGSANNLTPDQYAHIANKLDIPSGYTTVITAGPGEQSIAEQVANLINGKAVIYTSTGGLATFAKHIQFADLFISGSTGPLHIAGALNIPTAAFYPRRRSATPLRWQTLNSEDKRLAFTPAEESDEVEVSAIDIDAAIDKINHYYFGDEA